MALYLIRCKSFCVYTSQKSQCLQYLSTQLEFACALMTKHNAKIYIKALQFIPEIHSPFLRLLLEQILEQQLVLFMSFFGNTVTLKSTSQFVQGIKEVHELKLHDTLWEQL